MFPEQVWDGLNPTRKYKTDYRECTQDDYNILVEELIATQKHVLTISTGRRIVTTQAERDAIPFDQRQIGMIVFVTYDQIDWQLSPGITNNDWVVYGTIPAYSVPTFSFFEILDQDTIVGVGTTISGAKTFNWLTTNSSNIVPNSITIIDTTNNAVLASNLANDGTQNIILPSSITQNTIWTIKSVDTKGNEFSKTFSTIFVPTTDAVYYVRPGGNDSNTGLIDDNSHAWLTLQYAANKVGSGDTVNVRAGTYAGFQITTSGVSGHRISFLSDAGVLVNAKHSATSAFAGAINLEGASYITIDGFNVVMSVLSSVRTNIRSVLNNQVILRNNVIDKAGFWGILTGFSNNILIENNHITNTIVQHGIYHGNTNKNAIIRGNYSAGNNQCGIQLNGDISQGGSGIITNALLENNTLVNNAIGGGASINFDGVQNSKIRNNEIYGGHRSGIALYKDTGGGPSNGNSIQNNTIVLASDSFNVITLLDGAINTTINNNILYTSSNYASINVSADSRSGLVSDYNVIINKFSPDDGTTSLTFAQWKFIGYDTHSLISTPSALFVNTSVNDYHLKAGSPAIDAGTNTNVSTTDLDGNTRTLNSITDIGCYEFDSNKPLVVSVTPTQNQLNAPSGVVTITFNVNVDSASIVFSLKDTNSSTIAGTKSYDSPSKTMTFTPSGTINPDAMYTATLTDVTFSTNNHIAANYIWSFKTSARPSIGPHRLFGGVLPSIIDSSDSASQELGTRFKTEIAGQLLAIRFHKSIANTGTHVGNIYGNTGTLLGSTTFSGETSSGWQSSTLNSPVALVANTLYVVTFTAPVGHYSSDHEFFVNDYVVGPLTATADVSNSHNGLYQIYGGFPLASFRSSNYWVDLDLETNNPANNTTNVATSIHPSATFNVNVQSGTIIFVLKDHLTNVIPGSVAYNATTHTATFTPTDTLDIDETYTVTISGAVIQGGTFSQASPQSWSFTTVHDARESLFGNTDPGNTASDSTPITCGMKFDITANGTVLGVRFYKDAANTGTHIGALWLVIDDNSGTLLVSKNFTGETASGWQEVLFDSPISITTGNIYMAGVYMPNNANRYLHNAFNSDVIAGHIVGIADGTNGLHNGTYHDGSGLTYPSSNFLKTHYGIDAIFLP